MMNKETPYGRGLQPRSYTLNRQRQSGEAIQLIHRQ